MQCSSIFADAVIVSLWYAINAVLWFTSESVAAALMDRTCVVDCRMQTIHQEVGVSTSRQDPHS